MNRIIFIIIFFSLFGCNPDSNKLISAHSHRTEINFDSLPVQLGNVIEFKIDSLIIDGIVLDFDKDEAGTWIGICFIVNNRLFGRQIPNGLINTSCEDRLDLVYINSKVFPVFTFIDSIQVNKEKIKIGSITTVSTPDAILKQFIYGRNQRTKQQTPYNEKIFDLDAVRECYFDFKMIEN